MAPSTSPRPICQPRTTALASPRSCVRRRTRRAGKRSASASAVRQVPSGLSSSTTMSSYAPGSARSRTALTASTNAGRVAASLRVGTARDSRRARPARGGRDDERPRRCRLEGRWRGHNADSRPGRDVRSRPPVGLSLTVGTRRPNTLDPARIQGDRMATVTFKGNPIDVAGSFPKAGAEGPRLPPRREGPEGRLARRLRRQAQGARTSCRASTPPCARRPRASSTRRRAASPTPSCS